MRNNKEIIAKINADAEFRRIRNAASSLGITIEQYEEAVKVVGNKTDAIRRHLNIAHRNPYLRRTSPGRWRL